MNAATNPSFLAHFLGKMYSIFLFHLSLTTPFFLLKYTDLITIKTSLQNWVLLKYEKNELSLYSVHDISPIMDLLGF